MRPSHSFSKTKTADFGQFLRELRLKARYTQKMLSRKFGIKKETISSWENRHSFPSDRSLKAIAELFRVPFGRLEKIKERHRDEYRRKLIQNSADPVVTGQEPAAVPLFDQTLKTLPLDEIKRPEKWRGPSHPLPAELFPGAYFAFRLPDRAMEPLCRSRDVVIVGLHEKPRNGCAVLVKVKGHPPRCRIYLQWTHALLFVTPKDLEPSFRVREGDIEWCYGIVSALREAADIFS